MRGLYRVVLWTAAAAAAAAAMVVAAAPASSGPNAANLAHSTRSGGSYVFPRHPRWLDPYESRSARWTVYVGGGIALALFIAPARSG